MAAKKEIVLDKDMEEDYLDRDEDYGTLKTDGMTFAVPAHEEKAKGPTVQIFLPEIQGGGGDLKVDQYEHVTIANQMGEKHWKVHRGEYVEVPVEVYMVLKAKYPNL